MKVKLHMYFLEYNLTWITMNSHEAGIIIKGENHLDT